MKIRKKWPNANAIKKRLRYDPDTGKIFHLPRTPEDFSHTTKPEALARTFNARYAGREWGQISGNGHRLGEVDGYSLWASHVSWLFSRGEWPDSPVQHINGDYQDNHPKNLCLATKEEISRNTSRHKTNTSGVAGVHWDKARGKWSARIKDHDKHHFLGRFDDLQEAQAARKQAEREIGYHENHGNRPSRFLDHPTPSKQE